MGEIVGEIEKGRAYSQENNFFEIRAGSQNWSTDRSKENHIGRKFLQILDSDWGQYTISNTFILLTYFNLTYLRKFDPFSADEPVGCCMFVPYEQESDCSTVKVS